MAENLPQALAREIERNRELLDAYRAIPTGAYGAARIDQDIRKGIASLASGDVIQIMIAYDALKGNK